MHTVYCTMDTEQCTISHQIAILCTAYCQVCPTIMQTSPNMFLKVLPNKDFLKIFLLDVTTYPSNHLSCLHGLKRVQTADGQT